MIGYDITCPDCGYLNKDVFLEETEGRAECENCNKDILIPGFKRRRLVPVLTPENLHLFKSNSVPVGVAVNR